MSSARPAAGWHPDPDDAAQMRWWDGLDWTDHRSPAPGTPEGAAPAPTPPPAPGATIAPLQSVPALPAEAARARPRPRWTLAVLGLALALAAGAGFYFGDRHGASEMEEVYAQAITNQWLNQATAAAAPAATTTPTTPRPTGVAPAAPRDAAAASPLPTDARAKQAIKRAQDEIESCAAGTTRGNFTGCDGAAKAVPGVSANLDSESYLLQARTTAGMTFTLSRTSTGAFKTCAGRTAQVIAASCPNGTW